MSWKELRRIITGYQSSDGPFALATLVKSKGSTYRQPGSRMLILQGGPFIGRLSAGCLEEEIAELAQSVIFLASRRDARLICVPASPVMARSRCLLNGLSSRTVFWTN